MDHKELKDNGVDSSNHTSADVQRTDPFLEFTLFFEHSKHFDHS